MSKSQKALRKPRKQATEAETPRSHGRVPPPNARTIKPSYKTGTISRAAARAAILSLRAKAVSDE
jgi:hypothetical protein